MSINENGEKEVIFTWKDTNKFLENKLNLGNLLKTFSLLEIRDIYLEGRDRGIIKRAQEKIFLNVLTRMKLKIPLTTAEFNEMIPFYIAIMEEIISEENQNIDNSEEKPEEEEKKISKIDEEIMNILF